jgi:hypothetical protein
MSNKVVVIDYITYYTGDNEKYVIPCLKLSEKDYKFLDHFQKNSDSSF